MIYGCSQPRELWFTDFNHVHIYTLHNLHEHEQVYTCTVYIVQDCRLNAGLIPDSHRVGWLGKRLVGIHAMPLNIIHAGFYLGGTRVFLPPKKTCFPPKIIVVIYTSIALFLISNRMH